MPRIADRIALLGFKPTTHDRMKRQQTFQHEIADALAHLNEIEGNLSPQPDWDTDFDPNNFSY